jgi:NAD(P)H-dependent FMN reductase
MCNSVPAGLKNSFLMFGRFELGHKPAMIVAVSSGDDVLTRWLNYV